MHPRLEPNPNVRRLRLAVVVQRYGEEINGGAELHARQFVQAMQPQHEVTVLTSCARDYTSWDTYYPVGQSEVQGVRVLRFAHPKRGHSGRATVPKRHLLRYRAKALYRALKTARVASPSGNSDVDGPLYLEQQGPYCVGLVEHLLSYGKSEYDLIVFFTALYFPTACGLPAVAGQLPTVLVPTLHDERSMALPVYREVFQQASHIWWNCRAEQLLAQQLYGPQSVAAGSLCGVGVELPPVQPQLGHELRSKLGLSQPYFVFVGRVSRSKGFHHVAEHFAALQRRLAKVIRGGAGLPSGNPEPGPQVDADSNATPTGATTGATATAATCPVQLVVVGQSFMKELPQIPGLVYAGFLSEPERDALVAGALASVVSSRHESLSLVTLESMALGTPVLVNGRSPVLRAHVADSSCGWVYESFGFRPNLQDVMLRCLAQDPQARAAMAQAGQRYVAEQYSWARVLTQWQHTLSQLCP